jgi:hypothetical protein
LATISVDTAARYNELIKWIWIRKVGGGTPKLYVSSTSEQDSEAGRQSAERKRGREVGSWRERDMQEMISAKYEAAKLAMYEKVR